MEILKKLYDFNKAGMSYVIIIFLVSILTFFMAITTSFKVSKILYFSSSILFLGSSIYSYCYILKQYKKSKA